MSAERPKTKAFKSIVQGKPVSWYLLLTQFETLAAVMLVVTVSNELLGVLNCKSGTIKRFWTSVPSWGEFVAVSLTQRIGEKSAEHRHGLVCQRFDQILDQRSLELYNFYICADVSGGRMGTWKSHQARTGKKVVDQLLLMVARRRVKDDACQTAQFRCR